MAIFALVIGGIQGIAGGIQTVFGTAYSLFSFSLDFALALLSFFVELGGYALTGATFLFTLFTACLVPVFSEVMRPATEWRDSEASRSGAGLACVACVCVLALIFVASVAIAFAITTAWYDVELATGDSVLKREANSLH